MTKINSAARALPILRALLAALQDNETDASAIRGDCRQDQMQSENGERGVLSLQVARIVNKRVANNTVEITLRGVPRSDALLQYIDEQGRALLRQCALVQTCHAMVETMHQHRQQGTQFSVRLNITLPGAEVVVSREHAEDVRIAVREAFRAAALQLEDHARRRTDAGAGNP
jgi:ribosome-associated translation inhibitor RaiA